ncbi:MAG: PepSY domain-containing protein [Acidobacteria bacterium]|nr:PepSY domain-containing protein [Acidobacteriota bacterium]
MNRFVMIMLSLAFLSGCTSAPVLEEKPEPPDLITGRTAFQKLYISAHGWAPDAKPYKLDSQAVGDHRGAEGKAVLWRAAFASQGQRSSRPYVWSGIDSPDAPSRGVSPGAQDNFTPGNAFDVNFLKIDSDKAYQVAQKHGGEGVRGTPITYLLDWAPGENKLVWHVIYGPGRNDAKLVVDVDATTGEFLRKEK